jgi:hypothetical protein
VIGETEPAGIKDMGRVMGVLGERQSGVIDFARGGDRQATPGLIIV